jgi:hypothetical protein
MNFKIPLDLARLDEALLSPLCLSFLDMFNPIKHYIIPYYKTLKTISKCYQYIITCNTTWPLNNMIICN